MKLIPVIGLEIHIEQNTKTKMFCTCPADHFATDPNSQVCPVCLGLPGALPFANKKAIENTIALGLALDCQINKLTKFDRKHYFYPDLPKGYQISQYDLPLCYDGAYEGINIKRIHQEEDTAKSIHDVVNGERSTLIDFNRSGVPLIEIVTEPDFDSSEKVDKFLKQIQLVVRYLQISTADMEKGSMRLEANISLKEENATDLPNYKIELKNINSFRFLKKAIEAEIKRQTELLKKGETPIQETRGYDENADKTFSQRTKEDAHDYRYFPEPDIPPLTISDEDIQKIKSSLPELPVKKASRLAKDYDLSEEYVNILISDLEKSDYFEESVKLSNPEVSSPKFIAGMIINQNLDKKFPSPADFVRELINLTNKDFASQEDTEKTVEEVINQNQDIVEKYKSGKNSVLGYLLGQVQKDLKGRADPHLASKILRAKMS